MTCNIFASEKQDTIYFQNGDKLTCEVKGLKNNLLTVSTDGAGTINIKWSTVDSLYVKQILVIETTKGEYIRGVLFPSDTVKQVAIGGMFGVRLIPILSIVKIYPYGMEFFNKFTGKVSTGFSYAQANSIASWEFSGDIEFFEENYIVKTIYDGNWSEIAGGESSDRHNLVAEFYRILPKRYYYVNSASVERNTELELNIRANLGLSLGNYFILTNRIVTSGYAGVQVNHEVSQAIVSNNIEGVVGVNYYLFHRNTPKLDLTINSSLMPNISTFNRIRLNFNSELRWEVIKDVYLKYSVFYTFDSRPLSESAKNQDWSLSLGIEWEFD